MWLLEHLSGNLFSSVCWSLNIAISTCARHKYEKQIFLAVSFLLLPFSRDYQTMQFYFIDQIPSEQTEIPSMFKVYYLIIFYLF